jgi:hypothetical protein
MARRQIVMNVNRIIRHVVIARSNATKQSTSGRGRLPMDCFAALAMTSSTRDRGSIHYGFKARQAMEGTPWLGHR